MQQPGSVPVLAPRNPDLLEECDELVAAWKREFYRATSFKSPNELLDAALNGGHAQRFLKSLLALQPFKHSLLVSPVHAGDM